MIRAHDDYLENNGLAVASNLNTIGSLILAIYTKLGKHFWQKGKKTTIQQINDMLSFNEAFQWSWLGRMKPLAGGTDWLVFIAISFNKYTGTF